MCVGECLEEACDLTAYYFSWHVASVIIAPVVVFVVAKHKYTYIYERAIVLHSYIRVLMYMYMYMFL